MAFTDAQLSDLHKVWQYYKAYPYWVKNSRRTLTIRKFVSQVYAWALFSSSKAIPPGIILDPILKTKTNVGQALAYLISAKTGLRLSKQFSPVPRGEMISRIQRALH